MRGGAASPPTFDRLGKRITPGDPLDRGCGDPQHPDPHLRIKGVDPPQCEDQQRHPGWRWPVGCGRVMELGSSHIPEDLEPGGSPGALDPPSGVREFLGLGTCEASSWCGPRNPCARDVFGAQIPGIPQDLGPGIPRMPVDLRISQDRVVGAPIPPGSTGSEA